MGNSDLPWNVIPRLIISFGFVSRGPTVRYPHRKKKISIMKSPAECIGQGWLMEAENSLSSRK